MLVYEYCEPYYVCGEPAVEQEAVPCCGWLSICWMEAFLANKKSASAWRGELSSNSMVDTSASAIAWSDTARPRSRDLLSSRMVALWTPKHKDNVKC